VLDDLRADVRQYSLFGPWYRKLGFWIGATHRFGAWADRLPNRAARLVGLGIHTALSAPARIVKDVYLPASARIGPGFVMLHPFSIIVAPGIEIGANCQLFHEVTLGRGPIPGLPRVGDSVSIYAGAKILGGVILGDGVSVGANAVVIRDVPDGSVVAAPASRAIPPQTNSVVASPEARERAAARGDGPNGGRRG
jgi:serine O-acetyltransferase